ncbi:hypothetical protein BC832DRAFT_408256 [Gaertneriomyces semiglobifer]|nr:hypothetical protein BC832DRAFT_408256 [Gaertneriomyces semiglobifer]
MRTRVIALRRLNSYHTYIDLEKNTHTHIKRGRCDSVQSTRPCSLYRRWLKRHLHAAFQPFALDLVFPVVVNGSEGLPTCIGLMYKPAGLSSLTVQHRTAMCEQTRHRAPHGLPLSRSALGLSTASMYCEMGLILESWASLWRFACAKVTWLLPCTLAR